MSRSAIPVTSSSRAGVALPAETSGDASNNHTVQNDGHTIVLARNSNGGSTARTVTVHVSKTVDGQAVASRATSIAAAATAVIGPWPTSEYGTSVLLDVDNAELKLRAVHVA